MYAYSFFAITDCDGRIAAILIARVCGDGEANCLRIVDHHRRRGISCVCRDTDTRVIAG